MVATPQKLKSGRYKVRFRHGKSDKHDGPRETSESFDTLKKAKEFAGWLDALGPQGALDKLYEGEQAATVPTLDEVAADHIKFLTGVEHGTRVRYTRDWKNKWSPLIGTLPASDLDRDAVAAAVNALAEQYAEKTLKNQRGLLSAVAARAVEKGYLRTNPVKGVRVPRGAAKRVRQHDDEDDVDEMVLLSLAEWDILHAHIAPHYQGFTRFLIGTGARWGEAVVLQCGKTDTDAAMVRIVRALKDSSDGKRTIGEPKTKRGKRTVVLPSQLLPDLEERKRGRRGSELLFIAPRGGMIAHRTFWSDHWRPAIWRAQHCVDHVEAGCKCGTAHPKRCKIHEGKPPPPCGCEGTLTVTPRIHDLRHTHASWLLAAGIPIHIVSRRLGHESIQTTVDIYGHLLPDAQLAAAAAADLAFGTPIGPGGVNQLASG